MPAAEYLGLPSNPSTPTRRYDATARRADALLSSRCAATPAALRLFRSSYVVVGDIGDERGVLAMYKTVADYDAGRPPIKNRFIAVAQLALVADSSAAAAGGKEAALCFELTVSAAAAAAGEGSLSSLRLNSSSRALGAAGGGAAVAGAEKSFFFKARVTLPV